MRPERASAVWLLSGWLACSCAAASRTPDQDEQGEAADELDQSELRQADGDLIEADSPAELADCDACGPDNNAQLHLSAPRVVVSGETVPVFVRVTRGDKVARDLSGTVELWVGGGMVAPGGVKLVRGAGGTEMVVTAGEGEHALTAVLADVQASRPLKVLAEPPKSVELSGELDDTSAQWGPAMEVHVTSDVIVPEGVTLQIEPGTRVLLAAGVNVLVEGSLKCLGSDEQPVLWAPLTAGEAWGGIVMSGAGGEFEHSFIVGGGGDESRVFGHSQSQAVLFADGGEMSLSAVAVMDNPGKAMGAKAAVVKLKDCLITRCDTGGELVETLAQIRTSHFLDMPSEHGVFVDDDNDCLYLKGEYVDGSGDKPASLVEGCVFAVGKDDGIDHNGANVVVNDCSMEGFAHEGIACSGGGRIEIRNTLARQNEQGIEAGYGEPDVVVDHCVVTDNDVGFRYGDSYDWEVTGHLAVTNSISFGNQKHNVWNWVNLLDGPAADALDISYSMVDDPEWDGQAHNLAGQPVFDDAWRLAPGSPGVGKGSDGQDIGLLPE